MISSKRLRARRTTSTCPSVMGSYDPGHTAREVMPTRLVRVRHMARKPQGRIPVPALLHLPERAREHGPRRARGTLHHDGGPRREPPAGHEGGEVLVDAQVVRRVEEDEVGAQG